MNREVVTVSQHETMEQAAVRLAQFEVTGAPVVDDQGRCVGVLSASDYVGQAAGLHPSDPALVKESPHDPIHIERLDDGRVDAHMSPVIQTISPHATILQAARIMCGEHIHRLLVLDPQERPVGVISSLDLVASMIAAIEE